MRARILQCLFLVTFWSADSARATETTTMFYNLTTHMFFADGHFFYFTCERADLLIGKKLKRYPVNVELSGFIPYSFDSFFAQRTRLSYFQCAKRRWAANDLIARFGEPDKIMRSQTGDN